MGAFDDFKKKYDKEVAAQDKNGNISLENREIDDSLLVRRVLFGLRSIPLGNILYDHFSEFEGEVKSLSTTKKVEEYSKMIALFYPVCRNKIINGSDEKTEDEENFFMILTRASQNQINLLTQIENGRIREKGATITSVDEAKAVYTNNINLTDALEAHAFSINHYPWNGTDDPHVDRAKQILGYERCVDAQLYLLSRASTTAGKVNICNELSRLYTMLVIKQADLDGVLPSFQQVKYRVNAAIYLNKAKSFLNSHTGNTMLASYESKDTQMVTLALAKKINSILLVYKTNVVGILYAKMTDVNRLVTHGLLKYYALDDLSYLINDKANKDPAILLMKMEAYLSGTDAAHKVNFGTYEEKFNELKTAGEFRPKGKTSDTYAMLVKETCELRKKLMNLPDAKLDPVPDALKADYEKHGLKVDEASSRAGPNSPGL